MIPHFDWTIRVGDLIGMGALGALGVLRRDMMRLLREHQTLWDEYCKKHPKKRAVPTT